MLIEADYLCAYCGQPNETTVDPSAGRRQHYVEDCTVCCRPNTLRIRADAEAGVAEVEATFEE